MSIKNITSSEEPRLWQAIGETQSTTLTSIRDTPPTTNPTGRGRGRGGRGAGRGQDGRGNGRGRGPGNSYGPQDTSNTKPKYYSPPPLIHPFHLREEWIIINLANSTHIKWHGDPARPTYPETTSAHKKFKLKAAMDNILKNHTLDHAVTKRAFEAISSIREVQMKDNMAFNARFIAIHMLPAHPSVPPALLVALITRITAHLKLNLADGWEAPFLQGPQYWTQHLGDHSTSIDEPGYEYNKEMHNGAVVFDHQYYLATAIIPLNNEYKFALNETEQAYPIAMVVQFDNIQATTDEHQLYNHVLFNEFPVSAVNTTLTRDPNKCHITDIATYRGPHWDYPLLGLAMIAATHHAATIADQVGDTALLITIEFLRHPTKYRIGTIRTTTEPVITIKLFRHQSQGAMSLQLTNVQDYLGLREAVTTYQVESLGLPFELYRNKKQILNSDYYRAPSSYLKTYAPGIITLLTTPETPSIKLVAASFIADNATTLTEIALQYTLQDNARPKLANPTLPEHWSKLITQLILLTKYGEEKRYSSGAGGGSLLALKVTTEPGDSWLRHNPHGKYRATWTEYEKQLETRMKKDPKFKASQPNWVTQNIGTPAITPGPNMSMMRQQHKSYLAVASSTALETSGHGGPNAEAMYAKMKAELKAEWTASFHELAAPIYAGLGTQQTVIDELTVCAKELQTNQEASAVQATKTAEKMDGLAREVQETKAEVTDLSTEIERVRTTTMTYADFQNMQDIKDARAAIARQKERDIEREERNQDMTRLLQQHSNFSLQPIAQTVLALKRPNDITSESDDENEQHTDGLNGDDEMDTKRDDEYE